MVGRNGHFDAAVWLRWAPRVLLVVLALACLWLVVQLAFALLTRPQASVVVSASGARAQPASRSLDVAHWHLFGNGQRQQLRKQIIAASAETALNLVLRGTFAHADPRQGYALIGDEHGVERGYRVGDTLPDGVTLAAVYADHVVFDNHGRMENLRLPRESLHLNSPSAAAAAGVGAGATSAVDKPASKSREPMKQAIFIAPRMAHGAVDWQRARKQLAADPQTLLKRLDVSPVFSGSHMRGVRLGAAGPLLAKAGLRAGDVVTAVNGVPLDSPARGQQLAEQLRNARSVQVTIVRNGQPRTLTVQLR